MDSRCHRPRRPPPLVCLSACGCLLAQTGIKSLESEFAIRRGGGITAPNDMVPAFLFTVLICAPAACILAYLVLSLVIARWDYRRAIGEAPLKKDSFASSAILLVVGYVATFVMVGATSNSWVMGGINIANNLLWGVTLVLFYFLYRFARIDYSLSTGVKVIYGGALVLAAVFSNLYIKGWAPVEIATNYYGAAFTIGLYGALAVLILLYFAIDIRKKRRSSGAKRDLGESAEYVRLFEKIEEKNQARRRSEGGADS